MEPEPTRRLSTTAWAGAHHVNALICMVEQGLQLSTRYGGPWNSGQGGNHDFPLTDGKRPAKPAYYALKAFNQLAGATRISTSGSDHMNFAAMAGKTRDGGCRHPLELRREALHRYL